MKIRAEIKEIENKHSVEDLKNQKSVFWKN